MRRRLLLDSGELRLAGLVLVFGFVAPLPAPDYDPAPDALTNPIIAQAFRDVQLAPPAFWQDPTEQLASVLDGWNDVHADVLESADWSFASAFVHLSSSDPAPDLAEDGRAVWTYRLPGDLIRVREVGDPGITVWRIDGPWLRADAPPPLRLRYTSRVTDPARLPPSYQHVVTLRLAVHLAPRWLGRTPDAMRLEDEAAAALAQAKKFDGHGEASSARYTPGLENDGAGTDWASEALT